MKILDVLHPFHPKKVLSAKPVSPVGASPH